MDLEQAIKEQNEAHEKRLAELRREKEIFDLLPNEWKQLNPNIHPVNLYGVDAWVSVDCSFEKALELASVLDELPSEEISLWRGGGTTFKTDKWIATTDKETEDITPVLPMTVKVNLASFAKKYEVEITKRIGDTVIEFKLRIDTYRLKNLYISAKFNRNDKITDVELRWNDLNTTEGSFSYLKWWSSSLETSSYEAYWIRSNKTSEGFKTVKMLEKLMEI